MIAWGRLYSTISVCTLSAPQILVAHCASHSLATAKRRINEAVMSNRTRPLNSTERDGNRRDVAKRFSTCSFVKIALAIAVTAFSDFRVSLRYCAASRKRSMEHPSNFRIQRVWSRGEECRALWTYTAAGLSCVPG